MIFRGPWSMKVLLETRDKAKCAVFQNFHKRYWGQHLGMSVSAQGKQSLQSEIPSSWNC